jgi:RNA polymerase sigma-70 factor, ECF subfamily
LDDPKREPDRAAVSRTISRTFSPDRCLTLRRSMDSDEELYARTRDGDLAAFDVLYERYAGRLFGFVESQIRNRADAEEVFHEAFIKVLQGRAVRFEPGSFRTWLFRVARNITLNRLRSAHRGERAKGALPAPVPAPLADEALAERQRFAALEDAVARMSPDLRELYHLRTSGLSYDQLAEVLDVPLGTLKSRMHQMVTHLREELGSWIAR